MKRSGYSLIEVLLTIGVIGVVAGLSVPIYRTYQIRNDLNLATEQTIQGLSRAKLLAQNAARDSAWGFYVPSGTLYKGKNYLTRDAAFDEVYPMPSTITISGSILQVAYAKLEGTPDGTGSIVLTALDGEQRTITITIAVKTEEVAATQNDNIVICHKPGDPAEKTMNISDAALPGHLKHGDLMGPCPHASSSSSSLAPPVPNGPADMIFTITAPVVLTKGSALVYTITASNGEIGVATGVTFTDTMSTAFKNNNLLFDPANSNAACTKPANSDNITCSVGSFTQGQSRNYAVAFSTATMTCPPNPASVGNYVSGTLSGHQDPAKMSDLTSPTVNTALSCPSSSSSAAGGGGGGGGVTCFTTNADQLITTSVPVTMTIQSLASLITYGAGGPQIPVYLTYTTNNKKYYDAFNGNAVNASGGDLQTVGNIGTSAQIALMPRGYYKNGGWLSFNQAFATNDTSGHMLMFKNGDTVPNYPVFANQQNLTQVLKGRITAQRKVVLNAGELLILGELGSIGNPMPATADFQDIVLLLKFSQLAGGSCN